MVSKSSYNRFTISVGQPAANGLGGINNQSNGAWLEIPCRLQTAGIGENGYKRGSTPRLASLRDNKQINSPKSY